MPRIQGLCCSWSMYMCDMTRIPSIIWIGPSWYLSTIMNFICTLHHILPIVCKIEIQNDHVINNKVIQCHLDRLFVTINYNYMIHYLLSTHQHVKKVFNAGINIHILFLSPCGKHTFVPVQEPWRVWATVLCESTLIKPQQTKPTHQCAYFCDILCNIHGRNAAMQCSNTNIGKTNALSCNFFFCSFVFLNI